MTHYLVHSPLAVIAFAITLLTALCQAHTIFALVFTAIAAAAATRATSTALILLPVAEG